eukprot:scaffold503704_cov17-Prasinocladus_malaysianus.AAC.1
MLDATTPDGQPRQDSQSSAATTRQYEYRYGSWCRAYPGTRTRTSTDADDIVNNKDCVCEYEYRTY